MDRRKITAFLLILASSLLVFIIYASSVLIKKDESSKSEPLKVIGNIGQKSRFIVPKDVTLIFTGDVMLGRSVMNKIIEVGDNLYPFRNVSDLLKTGDLVFINLENPIVKNCPKHIGGFKFCTTYEIAEGLKTSGVSVVNLANNHTTNYGTSGLEETKKFLDDQGISYVGVGNLVIKEVEGIKFGFLGFNYTFSLESMENDIKLITESNNKVDVLVVGVHWGEEYKERANKMQIDTTKKMVDAGSDVIVGHHPHWVQNYEEISGVPVYYSLGNFIFDQMWSEETKKGLVVKMTFEGRNIVKREEFKTYIRNIGQPEIVTP